MRVLHKGKGEGGRGKGKGNEVRVKSRQGKASMRLLQRRENCMWCVHAHLGGVKSIKPQHLLHQRHGSIFILRYFNFHFLRFLLLCFRLCCPRGIGAPIFPGFRRRRPGAAAGIARGRLLLRLNVRVDKARINLAIMTARGPGVIMTAPSTIPGPAPSPTSSSSVSIITTAATWSVTSTSVSWFAITPMRTAAPWPLV